MSTQRRWYEITTRTAFLWVVGWSLLIGLVIGWTIQDERRDNDVCEYTIDNLLLLRPAKKTDVYGTAHYYAVQRVVSACDEWPSELILENLSLAEINFLIDRKKIDPIPFCIKLKIVTKGASQSCASEWER